MNDDCDRAMSAPVLHRAAERVLTKLAERGLTMGIAESLTGGLLAASLIAVPGASASIRGAVVAYDSHVKHTLLGVDAALLAEHGAVHPEVARQMAEGARAALAVDGQLADVGLSTTGVAGPEPQDGQGVGTVHIGIATARGTNVATFHLLGTRNEIRAQSVQEALRLAGELLETM